MSTPKTSARSRRRSEPGKSRPRRPHAPRGWRRLVFEPLESRRLLTDVSGHIAADTAWDNTSEPYGVTGALFVDAGVTLTVANGVRVTQANDCDVTVDGAVVLTSNAQWDADWHTADITVNGSLTMQAGSRLQVAGGAALTVNPSGTLTATDAEWLKFFSLQSYGYQSGLVVKGNATLSNTPLTNSGDWLTYVDVYSGGAADGQQLRYPSVPLGVQGRFQRLDRQGQPEHDTAEYPEQ